VAKGLIVRQTPDAISGRATRSDPFGLNYRRRAGTSEEISLGTIAAEFTQPVELQRCLNTFDDDRQSKAVPQADDCFDD
jgi:hypothetical protein